MVLFVGYVGFYYLLSLFFSKKFLLVYFCGCYWFGISRFFMVSCVFFWLLEVVWGR